MPAVRIEGPAVQLTALKRSEDERRLILRLFEPTGIRRSVRVAVPVLGTDLRLDIAPYEIKTVAVDLDTGDAAEADLLERDLDAPQGDAPRDEMENPSGT
jgi:hypothetical protein